MGVLKVTNKVLNRITAWYWPLARLELSKIQVKDVKFIL